MADVAEIVRTAVSDSLRSGRRDFADDASLFDDLGLDELDLVDVAITIEGALGVDLPDEALEGVLTVGDLVARVEKVARR